jgi:long-chain acyl-CoA synthetase
MNMYTYFYETTRRQPQHPAILGPGADQSFSYEQLNEAIELVSTQLLRAGVRAGDCVGLNYGSGARYVIFNFAIWRCGATVVPIPTELSVDEKQQILREISIRYVITSPLHAASFDVFRNGAGQQILQDAVVFATSGRREHPAQFQAINPAFIRFTSGTTAKAKGVVLSHETIYQRIDAANDLLKLGPQDRITWLLSMSYHFTVSIVAYLTYGSTIVLPTNHFAEAVLQSTTRHRSTVIYGSPLQYAWMADSLHAAPLPHVRLAISTTTALDARIASAFAMKFRRPVTQALGVIEIGLPCINVELAEDRPLGVGRVLPAYELRLWDRGLGPRLFEIHFRGPGMLDAYYNPWQPRDVILRDGWFHTGDVGELDRDGCLFIRGRMKEVIDVSGMKFFPQEVEAVLKAHPQVADACVFSAEDERLGLDRRTLQ